MTAPSARARGPADARRQADAPDWLAPLLTAPDEAAPPSSGGRASAVLILLGTGPHGPDVLLIERSPASRHHPGQVAFPGGAREPSDDGPIATALREAAEETGFDPDGVRVLRVLAPRSLVVSGFDVVPVLAWWARPSAVRPVDPAEVVAVARVPLRWLADPAHRYQVRYPNGGSGPAFDLRGTAGGGFFIWGFTARLLDWLLTAGGWAVPWPVDDVRDLPASADRA